MTYFSEQVIKLQAALYPKTYIGAQLKQSKDFIDRHFAENISLTQMAAAACCSRYHYIRLFKKYYGRTPHQYLSEKRLSYAKKMLQQGKSFAEVCTELNVGSSTSFSGLFKKFTGLSPQRYREKYFPEKAISKC